MKNNVYNAIITEEDGIFVALNPEYDVVSQGETVESAVANLREALELYLEELRQPNEYRKSSYLTTFSI